MKINMFLLVLLGVLFCNTLVFAQSVPPTEGKATQEMSDEGFAAATTRHYPFDSMVKITNTETGKEITVQVKGRIVSSPNRIVDLSLAAWEALELNSDTIITLSSVPIILPPPEIPDPPEWQNRSEAEQKQEEKLAELRATEIKQAEEKQEEKLAEIKASEEKPAVEVEVPAKEPIQPNFSQPLYHLLVLDRTYCAFNSDISDIEDANILYKFKHGKNGYLITLYTSPEGSAFPVIPDKSRVLVNTIAARKLVLREHLNSALFRRFVTNRTVLSQLRKALEDIKIIPALPKANSGKIYRIQVGAFAKPESAAAAASMLEHAGFMAAEERYGSLRRVFVKDIPATEIASAVQRLEFAGFKEVWIRE